MKAILKIISASVAAFVLNGCMADNLPKYNRLESLRILALVATAPEVDAGGTTTITPILSDIVETTSLTYEAIGCISLTSVDTSCSGNPTALAIQAGTLNSGDMTPARSFTGTATAFTVLIPAAGVIFDQRSAQDQFNGISYLVTYSVRNSRGDSIQSFRRIVVSTKPLAEKNQNPVLNDVLANGAALTTTLPASQKLSMTPSFGAITTESYRVLTDSGSYRTDTEEVVTTWFSTDGELKYYRSVASEENTFTAPDALPAGRDAFLIAVTRDGRGGIAFNRKCFGTCP
ncbi:MAG: hypothetical protein ACXWC9_02875 [Pseudobdellovibrionaceae bacterium]